MLFQMVKRVSACYSQMYLKIVQSIEYRVSIIRLNRRSLHATRYKDTGYSLSLLESVFVYLYWSGEYQKVEIRLRLTVTRSGEIVLSAVFYYYISYIETVPMSRGKTT